MAFTISDGKTLIELARNSIYSILRDKVLKEDSILKQRFIEKRGVFVTIHKNGELRGCIGFIEPIFSLFDSIVKASAAAALSDPRFPPLTIEEIKENNIEIEVSVLTIPQLVDNSSAEDCLNEIKVKRDGLIVEMDNFKGCLLPQVAGEYGWDEKQLLEHTCIKAGLDKDAWKSEDCHIYRFSAQIFSEKDGKVIESHIE
ncbi:MAG: TIGR00296 family protein [Nanoarchaeota archaeon]|nr:TIGR00296 family protein [Nanoarchaeota archaeon]